LNLACGVVAGGEAPNPEPGTDQFRLNESDTLLYGISDQISGGFKLKFLHHIIFMPLDCSYGDAQDVGDFFG
jgi:hypothetical protein